MEAIYLELAAHPMLFVLSTLNREGAVQEFPFNLGTLEAGLDFISRLAARKETIVSVYIVDKDNLTPLPVAVFDGSPLSAGIQQLQAEWQAILTKTPDEPVGTDAWVQRRLDQNAQSIVQQELLITRVRQLIEQLSHLRIPNVYKHTLNQHYQTTLAIYERQLTRLYSLRKRLSRLGQVAGH